MTTRKFPLLSVTLFLAACGGSAKPAQPPPVAATATAPTEATAEGSEESAPPADDAEQGEAKPECENLACVKACDTKKTASVCEEAMRYFEGLDHGDDMEKMSANQRQALKYGRVACDLGAAHGCAKSGPTPGNSTFAASQIRSG